VKWDEECQVKDMFTTDDEDVEDIEGLVQIPEAQEIPSNNKPAKSVPDTWESPPGTPVKASQVTKTSNTPDRDGTFSQRELRPARKKKMIIRYQDEFDGLVCMMAEVSKDQVECLMACEDEDEKMSTFQGIMTSDHKVEWKKAMDKEIKSI
jgi:hypothetical protein